MSQTTKVLIVEDESIVAMEIGAYVQELGFELIGIASSADKAIQKIETQDVGLILMDVHIKGNRDGISCAAEIQSMKKIPLIYISAFGDDETLERAIETEPVAYLTKPFNRKELKVAMRLATKKYLSSRKVGDLIFDDEFSFDLKNGELILLGEYIHLTKQEKLFLLLLIESKNSIVSFYEIENCLWPDKGCNENTRRALVSRLRSKLKYKFLETIHSIGYKLQI